MFLCLGGFKTSAWQEDIEGESDALRHEMPYCKLDEAGSEPPTAARAALRFLARLSLTCFSHGVLTAEVALNFFATMIGSEITLRMFAMHPLRYFNRSVHTRPHAHMR